MKHVKNKAVNMDNIYLYLYLRSNNIDKKKAIFHANKNFCYSDSTRKNMHINNELKLKIDKPKKETIQKNGLVKGNYNYKILSKYKKNNNEFDINQYNQIVNNKIKDKEKLNKSINYNINYFKNYNIKNKNNKEKIDFIKQKKKLFASNNMEMCYYNSDKNEGKTNYINNILYLNNKRLKNIFVSNKGNTVEFDNLNVLKLNKILNFKSVINKSF